MTVRLLLLLVMTLALGGCQNPARICSAGDFCAPNAAA